MQKQPAEKFFIIAIIACGWFALVTQLYLIVNSGVSSLGELVIRYFSYFTIQTNILVAVCFTSLLLAAGRPMGRFFSRQQTLSAITVYIVIVGLIYNTILRFLWQPEGLQKIVDELLHSVIPLAVLVYWFLYVAKDTLRWKNVLWWLLYPFAYIIYVLIRGSVSGFYPYPFINTQQLGMNKVLVNAIGIAAVFAFVSLLLVFVAKSAKSKLR